MNVQQGTKTIISTSANGSNLKNVESMSNNLSQSPTNTELSNADITTPQNVQCAGNYQNVEFPKGI